MKSIFLDSLLEESGLFDPYILREKNNSQISDTLIIQCFLLTFAPELVNRIAFAKEQCSQLNVTKLSSKLIEELLSDLKKELLQRENPGFDFQLFINEKIIIPFKLSPNLLEPIYIKIKTGILPIPSNYESIQFFLPRKKEIMGWYEKNQVPPFLFLGIGREISKQAMINFLKRMDSATWDSYINKIPNLYQEADVRVETESISRGLWLSHHHKHYGRWKLVIEMMDKKVEMANDDTYPKELATPAEQVKEAMKRLRKHIPESWEDFEWF